MKFLPVLLIALALLPLSAALKCHFMAKGPDASVSTKVICNSGTEYCFKGVEDGITVKGCDPLRCSEIGSSCETYSKATVCCCKGDYCNPAATPTLLLPLAAVAAMIAARR